MDLDFKIAATDLESLRAHEAALFRLIFDAVKGMLPDATKMVVCTAKPYPLPCGLTKVGYHLHWPGAQPVGVQAAMECRAACIEAARGAGLVLAPSWEDVFDTAVFRPGTGLRMIGSIKGLAAPTSSIYMPSVELCDNSEGLRVIPVANPRIGLHSWLRKTRVATPGPEEHQEHAAGPTDSYGSSADFPGIHGDNINISALAKGQLVECIRGCISPKFLDFTAAPVNKVFVLGGHSKLPTVILALNSKRCLNLRAPRTCHSGNHTYLVANKDGIWQRCHSPKHEVSDRLYGCCSQFSGRIGAPTRVLLRALSDLAKGK